MDQRELSSLKGAFEVGRMHLWLSLTIAGSRGPGTNGAISVWLGSLLIESNKKTKAKENSKSVIEVIGQKTTLKAKGSSKKKQGEEELVDWEKVEEVRGWS